MRIVSLQKGIDIEYDKHDFIIEEEINLNVANCNKMYHLCAIENDKKISVYSHEDKSKVKNVLYNMSVNYKINNKVCILDNIK